MTTGAQAASLDTERLDEPTLSFCERFRNLHVQLLSSTAQQAAMRGVLHQCMLKAVDCLGRPATLKDQFGSDEADERCLQLVFGKTGDATQQRIGEFASDRRADLGNLPDQARKAAVAARLLLTEAGANAEIVTTGKMVWVR